MYEILEPFGPLSRSTVWKRVADVYTDAGLAIWDSVPAVITGNALVGSLFAGAIEAWLLDQGDAVDPNEPLYVVEPGAGTGLFSHHFLTAIARRRASGLFPHPRVVLIMCDQSDAHIEQWSESAVLMAHVRAGTLAFATFAIDMHGVPGELTVKRGSPAPSSIKNPVVVVANYFFDSIPSDAFRVREGKVYEARTRFVRVLEAPGFEGLQNEEEVVEIGDHHYKDPALDGTLRSIARDHAEASVLMPIAGIRCVEALAKLSGGRMLLLSIDKGITGADRMTGWFEQPFVTHGGVFSYLVNFDAFRRYFGAKNGSAHCSASDDRPLVCFAGMLPAPADPGGHLQRFFADQIDSVDAVNAFVSFTQAIQALPKVTEPARIDALFDLLARMQADPDAFSMIMHRTVDMLPQAHRSVHRRARELAALAKECFLSPRFQNDVYYWSGRMHYALAELDAATKDFEASIANYGPTSHAHFFLGVINEERGKFATALREYAKHLALDRQCRLTRNAMRRVRAKACRRAEAAPRTRGRRSSKR
ncbi:MAG: SAM-dependent methyltransferase [Betaproteobacteria bacterium]